MADSPASKFNQAAENLRRQREAARAVAAEVAANREDAARTSSELGARGGAS